MARRNAAGPKPPSLGFAFPMPNPAGADPVDPLEAEAAAILHDQRIANRVRIFAPGALQSGVQAGAAIPAQAGIPTVIPQPASLGDAVNAASGISQMHREVAQTAMENAEIERERRQEAELSAGAMADAARKDEENKWSAIHALTNSFNERIDKLMEAQHAAELAAKDSEAARIAAEIKANADRIEAALQADRDRLTAELAAAKAKNAALAQRPTMQDMMVRAIQNPDDPELAPFRQVFSQGPRPQSPQERWAHGYVDEELAAKRDQRLMRRQRHLRFMSLSRNADALVGELRQHIPRFASGTPRGLGQNGVADDFPDEPDGAEGEPVNA